VPLKPPVCIQPHFRAVCRVGVSAVVATSAPRRDRLMSLLQYQGGIMNRYRSQASQHYDPDQIRSTV